MKRKLGFLNTRRVFNVMTTGLFLASAILIGFAQPVVAAGPPDGTIYLPAGTGCSFDLQIDYWGAPQVYKEFVDKNGNVVRTLLAGTGSELLFTNLSTGATFSTQPNGAVQQTTINPDGSYTVTMLGHNILILFPTDVPAGPSTTLYVGRVVFTIDTSGTFTLNQADGKDTDICAALSV
jgi:hypothetical protein